MHLPHVLLLAAGLMASPGPQAVFTDVTAESGIPSLKYAEGVNVCDLDGDGLPEIFLPSVKGRDRLFKNLGGCRFQDVTDVRGISGSGGIGAVVGDISGDGRPDIYVVRGAYPYGMNVLHAQGPDGVFADVTGKSGAAARKNGISAVLADFDCDGRLDIFAANWGVNTLYRNTGAKGAPAFEDVTEKAGLSVEGRSWGAVAADFDSDGLPDLFVSRGGFDKKEDGGLYMNRGKGVFVDRTAGSGIKGVGWSMGAVSCDFDMDGDPDLFAANYEGPDRLYINDGKARFTDATEGSGITSSRTVGVAAGDVDGDLLPDIVTAGFAGPVRFFRNLGGGRFRAVEGAGTGPYRKNEGAVLADLDGDGDLDLYVANYEGNNRLYRNDLPPAPYLKVLPVENGRAAIGAKVSLYREDGPGNRKAALAAREVQAGFGFCSQAPPEALFSLPADGPYELLVEFPCGKAVGLKGVRPGALRVEKPVGR